MTGEDALSAAHSAVLESVGAQLELHVAQEQHYALGERLLLRLRALLLAFDFEFAEMVSGLAGLGWGLWVMAPWDAFGSTPTFANMERFLPEWVWGLVVCVVGAAQLLGVVGDRWEPEGGPGGESLAHRWRRHLAFGSFLMWLFIAGFLASSNFRGTSTVIYPMFALCSAWAYLRLAVRRGQRWSRF